MSEMSKDARAAMKAKAKRMTSADPHKKVDASSWVPMDAMNTTKKRGPRPLNPNAFAFGGSVKPRADKKQRKANGGATNPVPRSRMEFGAKSPLPLPNSGMKKGGRAGKSDGGFLKQMLPSMASMGAISVLNKLMGSGGSGDDKGGDGLSGLTGGLGLKRGGRATKRSHKDIGGMLKNKLPLLLQGAASLAKKDGGTAGCNYTGGTRPTGGRIARKHGGRMKDGKTNVNIVIATGKGGAPEMGGPMPMPPPRSVPVPPPTPPMPGGMPGAPGLAGPPGMPPMPPMGRKDGGKVGHRTYRSAKDMDAGGLSGMGRLEKTEIQKNKR